MGLPRNPVAAVERPRYRISDDIDAFAPEEVRPLVRAAASEQDGAMFMTAAFAALRLGELVALQWRDADFVGEVIRVRRSYNVHGGLGTPESGKVRLAEAFRSRVCQSQRPRATLRALSSPQIQNAQAVPKRG